MTTKRFEPNEQRRIDVAAITEMVNATANGSRPSWVEFEQGTGVTMNTRGRSLVTETCDALERPYLSIPGYGIEFSSAENAEVIMRKKLARVGSAVGKAHEVSQQLCTRHLPQMSSAQQQRMLEMRARAALLDSFRESASKADTKATTQLALVPTAGQPIGAKD